MSGTADFWGPLITGISLMAFGCAGAIQYLRFRQRAERVPGVVVQMREGTAMKYGVLHYPVLEFTTRSGRQIRTTSGLGTNPAQARIGDSVTVSYDPYNPMEAEIAAKGGIRLLLMLLFVLGGVFSVVFAWMQG